MPSNYANAISGLGTVLGTAITSPKKVHVYSFPPDSIQELPAVVLQPMDFDPRLMIGGNSFQAQIRATLLLAKADGQEAFEQLYEHIDPTAASAAFIKAIKDSPTLGGNVDDAGVIGIANIGRREIGGGWYVGCDYIVEVVKSVT